MKKIICTLALLIAANAAQAQVTVTGSKFTDNWSVTLKGGAVAPFQNYKYWKACRGIAGVELRKQVTPVLGLGVEGEWTFNTSSWLSTHSANVVDHQYVGAFGALNLNNIVAGYSGSPRFFEVEGVAGMGWAHAYFPIGTRTDWNTFYTKAGLNLNFNLGESRAWTASLKPAVVWNMDKGYSKGSNSFNANYAMVEMEAGITYHFGNSNGTHSFTICDKQYTQADIDALNAEINALRARQPETKIVEKVVEKVVEKPVEKVVKGSDSSTLESNVFFGQGKSVVTAAQLPNVERVATFLKNHPGATVVIRGYASPEGSKEINERLARERAEAVKTLLVNRYKVAASRIDAQGQGVGDMFSEPDWNRVSVCTITAK